jgi:hypothetical protein
MQILSIQRSDKRALQRGDLFTSSEFPTCEEAITDARTPRIYGFGNIKWW